MCTYDGKGDDDTDEGKGEEQGEVEEDDEVEEGKRIESQCENL